MEVTEAEKTADKETAEAETTETADAPKMARPLILGRKLGMLQHFKEDGSVVASVFSAVSSAIRPLYRASAREPTYQ